MATIELTLEQIVDAAQQLKDGERLHLISELVNRNRRKEATKAVEELRPQYEMPRKTQRRMSVLLTRSNEGVITAAERSELATLVDEYQQRSLELAQAVSDRVAESASRRDTA